MLFFEIREHDPPKNFLQNCLTVFVIFVPLKNFEIGLC